MLEDPLGHLPHGKPKVHGRLLHPPKSIRLAELELLLQHPLGTVDQLARLQALGQVGNLGIQHLDLAEPAERHLEGRSEVEPVEWFDQIGHRAGVAGTLDQVALAERRQDHHGRDPLRCDPLRRGDPVQPGHLDIEYDEIRAKLFGKLDGLLPVPGLANHVVALLAEHLCEVEPDQRLVLGDDNARPGRAGSAENCLLAHRPRLVRHSCTMHLDRLGRFSAIVLAGLVLSACESPHVTPETAAPSVTLSFVQWRYDEGTPRAQLRVINHENTDLAITGVGLDWAGYGGSFRSDYDATIRPKQTLDLRIVLPSPDCSEGSGPVYGLVESGSRTVRSRLDASGQGVLTRIWERECATRYVTDRVSVTYGDKWRRTGSRQAASLLGTIRLKRRQSAAEIRLVSIRGSVLFGLRLPRRAELAPEAQAADFPLQIRPGRCDEHALMESSATFQFRATVRFGNSPPATLILKPGPRIQSRALALLALACR